MGPRKEQLEMSNIIGGFGIPLVIIAVGVAMLSVIMMVARNYKKCPPSEAMVLSGRKHNIVDAGGKVIGKQGFRLVVGGAAFRFPLLERIDYLSLEVFQVEFSVQKTPNVDGVAVSVDAVANLRISSQPNILAIAVGQLLRKGPQQIMEICRNTLEGQLRQIVGTLTVEDMVRDREKITQQVLAVAELELAKTGIELVNFTIKGIFDEEGYIEAMGKTKTAEVKRDAEIGQANAKRAATIAASTALREGEQTRLDNEAQVAKAARDLAIKQADYQAETDQAKAKAALAGQMQTAQVERELKVRLAEVEEADAQARIAVAEQQAARREKELITEQIKPAEATRTAAVIKADGEAQATVKAAEGKAKASVTEAEGTASAVKMIAEADKVKLQAEGEGQAAAAAANKKQVGLAEAEVTKARMLAEAEGTSKKGEAEGVAIQAKLLAEAMGLQKKNEALSALSEGAKLILILEALPKIIDEAGEAGQKICAAMFEQVGAGLSRIDSVHIVDMGGGKGGNGTSPVANFALAIPEVVFGFMQKLRATGIDVDGIMKKLGIDASKMIGIPGAETAKHPEAA